MCKLLLLGVNTRSMVISALSLGFDVYSSSYYKTYDFDCCINEKHILDQVSGCSCGYFEDNYSPEKILSNAESYLDIVDYIVLCSGISALNFKGRYEDYLDKIVGNVDIVDIEDKYLFYKKVRSDFLVPDTFNVNDIHEVNEIIKNNKDSEYILKPRCGSGGYNTYLLKYNDLNERILNEINTENFYENEWILQKKINGTNISSSVLSTKNKAKTIINSRLLNLNDYNISSYKYGGNILPLTEKSIKILNKKENLPNKINNTNLNKKINQISEKIIKKLKLIGNNGVDLILTPENETYIIEVNPRLQGTYECIEQLLEINLLDAHIKACHNELIEIPKIKKQYIMKKLLYTNSKIKVEKIKTKNIHDIPYPNVIIEKNQPLATIITKNINLKEVYENIIKTERILKNNIKKIDS